MPDARQQLVMDAVAAALQAGMFAAREVADHVAATLGVEAPVRAVKTLGVEGGDFAYDCYFAERALDVRRRREAMSAAAAEQQLRTGERLGTLVFGDGRQAGSATVTSISTDGSRVGLSVLRGSRWIAIDTDALSLKAAIDRAREMNRRDDSYTEFLAARGLHGDTGKAARHVDPRQQTLFA